MTRSGPRKPEENNYVGRSGQLHVMSELLFRGYNVAIPEVDDGDDVFVVQGKRSRLWRLQVKTARLPESGLASFNLRWSQLMDGHDSLWYAFVTRDDIAWRDVIVIPADKLAELMARRKAPTTGDCVTVRLRFTADDVTLGRRSLQHLRDPWPRIDAILQRKLEILPRIDDDA